MQHKLYYISICKKGFIAIPGLSNTNHIKENIDIFNFTLSDDEMDQIQKINKEKRYFNVLFKEQKRCLLNLIQKIRLV